MSESLQNTPQKSPGWVTRLVAIWLVCSIVFLGYLGFIMKRLADKVDASYGDPLTTLPMTHPVVGSSSAPPRELEFRELPSEVRGDWEIVEHWYGAEIDPGPKWTTRIATIGRHDITLLDLRIHEVVPRPVRRQLVAAQAENRTSWRFWDQGVNVDGDDDHLHVCQMVLRKEMVEQFPGGILEFRDGELWLGLAIGEVKGEFDIPTSPNEGMEVFRLIRPIRRPEGFTERELEMSRNLGDLERKQSHTHDDSHIPDTESLKKINQ